MAGASRASAGTSWDPCLRQTHDLCLRWAPLSWKHSSPGHTCRLCTLRTISNLPFAFSLLSLPNTIPTVYADFFLSTSNVLAFGFSTQFFSSSLRHSSCCRFFFFPSFLILGLFLVPFFNCATQIQLSDDLLQGQPVQNTWISLHNGSLRAERDHICSGQQSFKWCFDKVPVPAFYLIVAPEMELGSFWSVYPRWASLWRTYYGGGGRGGEEMWDRLHACMYVVYACI